LQGVKPGDAIIVGMDLQFNDQIWQTPQVVREIGPWMQLPSRGQPSELS